MDLVLYILLIVLFVLTLVYFKLNEKVVKKNKTLIYGCLVFIIVFLSIGIYNSYSTKNRFGSKQNFQNGGKVNSRILKQQILKNKCGLPKSSSDLVTNHCFADGTHHTCCMLGPKARKGSDATGNPIGSASVRAYSKKNPNTPITDETLTPWCTCSGSNVCSYYADKYKDGTHVAFVNNPNALDSVGTGIQIAEGAPSECEPYFRDKFNIIPHGTPGVKKLKNKRKLKKMCEGYIKSI